MTPQETESEQGRWFLAWWGILPTQLFTSKTKGSREEAWKEWQKLSPDRETCAKIGTYTQDRTKHWNSEINRGVKMVAWKHAVRLLRYRFWEDSEEFTSGRKRERGALSKCKCGAEIEHVNTCFACFDAAKPVKHWSDAMIDRMISR